MGASQLLWSLFALSVTAQSNNALPISGVFAPGPSRTLDAVEVLQLANQHPNATNAVTFSRLYNNTEETWSWRVNVTDLAIPNRIDDLGKPSANSSEGLRVANTVWQLNWPGSGGNLSTYLAERGMSITIHTMVTNKPNNITSRYRATDNGNCSAVLGDQCAQSLTRAASSTTSFSFANLDGCEDSLDVYVDGAGGGSSLSVGSDTSSGNRSMQSTVVRDDSFFYRTSAAYTASNVTELHLSESALQVFVMNVQYGNGPRGESSGPTVLCQIVDNSSDTTKAKDPPSAAASWHPSMAMVWSTVMLSALVIMWR